MEEPGGLQSMGSLRIGHDWATSLSLFTFMHWRGKWQPTPVFLPRESQGGGAWWAAVYGVAQSRTRLKQCSSSPCDSAGKESACGRPGFDPWVGTIPWRRGRLPTPVFWPGKFHGLCSPWDCKDSDTTERLSLSSRLSKHWVSMNLS